MLILKIAIFIILVIGLILLIWACIEPRLLNIKRETIEIKKNEGAKSSCAKLFYLSDLHAEFCFIPVEKVINIIRDEYKNNGLDAVVFGGDLCNNPKKYQKGANYLNRIALVCKELGIPFLGTNGNHDADLTQRELEFCGFYNMANKNYLINLKDDSILRFSGVPDSGRKNRIWMDIPECSDNYDMHIFLAHNPDQVLHINGDMPDAMLSGHIHGGQIRTPIRIEYTLLRKDELPHRGITDGLYDIAGTKLYISKGIGCIRLPFRIMAKPEVNILTIIKK